MKILIIGAPRSGNHKVLGYIEENMRDLTILSDNPNDLKKIDSITHNILILSHFKLEGGWLPPDPKNWILIRPYRNDFFNQTLSDVIAQRHQYVYNKNIDPMTPVPFILRLKDFDENIDYFKKIDLVIKSIDPKPFRAAIDLTYKEICKDTFVKKLPINGKVENIKMAKTPWKKRDIILNYDIIKEHYYKRK